MYSFVKSSTNAQNWLMNHKYEVCFIGRSNVGKSSLINAVVNQKSLAKTSNKPGKTQLINFFQDNKKTLVDLPGYGYAKIPIQIKNNISKMIKEYFENRKQLILTLVLIDSKIGLTLNDINMIKYLNNLQRNVIIILTKIDKVNQSEKFATLKEIQKYSNNYLITSAYKGKNISKLRKIINNYLSK